ncbi:MAG: zinc-ribbon domain-containing protein [Planctomycetota bacterium]|nr:zinc-ribbon domain-containing protein [Planctomycetota bacterium]
MSRERARIVIRVRCPQCNAKMKAPDELAGKKGRCPMCASEVLLSHETDPALAYTPPPPREMAAIKLEDTGDDEQLPTPVADEVPADSGLKFTRPVHLKRNCHYLICNSKEVIARWDDDGKGWMVQVKDGFVKAAQNAKQIPTMGNYVFIEIEIVSEGPHQRLAGVNAYTIPSAFALIKLTKQDNAILEALEQTTELSDRQRALVRQRVNAKYLPSIWDDAADF